MPDPRRDRPGTPTALRTATAGDGAALACLGLNAHNELFEWGAAAALGQGADEFLATQGDIWDTQKDMPMAGIGAVLAQWLLARWRDAQIARLPASRSQANVALPLCLTPGGGKVEDLSWEGS